MIDAAKWPEPKTVVLWLSACVCLSVASLAWFGYTAVAEWERTSLQFAERRTQEASNLLVTGLMRDMQGAQRSVLSSDQWNEATLSSPYEVLNIVATAFSRYPYPESFFISQDGSGLSALTFFNRRDRPPTWMSPDLGRNKYPVVVANPVPAGRALLDRIRLDAEAQRPFSMFETLIGDTRYQVIATLRYENSALRPLRAVFGFTVSLPWVRQNYFQEFATHVAQIDSVTHGMTLLVVDERGQPITGGSLAAGAGPISERSFPVLFFDSLLVAARYPSDLSYQRLTVRAVAAADATLDASLRGAKRMQVLGLVALMTFGLGVFLTLRALSASINLTHLRSEFVSGVSHELKTPIATIQAAAETLGSGQIADSTVQREYARIVVQEAKRLSHLIENLLVFSRVTDVGVEHSIESVTLESVIDQALYAFRLQLKEHQFDVSVRLPFDLPPVLADRTAIALVLENVIDNAIRHARKERGLEISARLADSVVLLEVRDRGPGIPEDEIEHVTKKFFRGRNARSGGTGLGLAIANRIIAEHHGTLTVRSAAGVGTTIIIALPKSAEVT